MKGLCFREPKPFKFNKNYYRVIRFKCSRKQKRETEQYIIKNKNEFLNLSKKWY